MNTNNSAIVGPLVGASFLGGVFGGIARAEGRFPRPGSTDGEVREYYERNTTSAQLSATGQLVSTLSLARFAFTVDSVTRDAGSRWLRVANVVGSTIAVVALGTSGLTTARLAGPARHDDATAARLVRRAFVAGGPVHGFGFGLMTGALALAGARTGDLGPGIVRTGLVSAASGLASPSYFAAEPAGWLIPIGRFTGLAVVAAAGVRLRDGRRPR
jgi:hypothetical protein